MYNCYFCKLKFLNRDDLFDHFKKIHNTLKSPLVCGLCKEKGNVQVQEDLQDHLLKFHPDEDFIQTFALAPLASNSKPETIVEPKSKKQKLKPGKMSTKIQLLFLKIILLLTFTDVNVSQMWIACCILRIGK